MKNLLATLLLICSVLTITACGGDTTEAETAVNQDAINKLEEQAEELNETTSEIQTKADSLEAALDALIVE